MLKLCSYIWRLIMTWLAFILFGLASIIASLLLIIPYLILPKRNTQKLSQKLIKFSYKVLLTFLTTTSVMEVSFENLQLLRDLKGTLIIANHPTFLDVVALLSEVDAVDCIVKSALWHNPFFVGIVKTAQYINSSNPHEMISICQERLQSGHNILIFPEGTRSNPDHLQEFKRGFASIALLSQCKIIPVFFHCHPLVLTKQSKWYETSKSKFTLRVCAFPEIPVEALLSNIDDKTIQSKELSKQIESFYNILFKNNGQNANDIYQQHFASHIKLPT